MNSHPPLPCPQCGTPIPHGAPQGICPRCLLQNAMNPTVVQQDNPVPPPEEIVRAFPNLDILQLIGAGGMGRVYKVRQPHLDRIVALKILQPELAGDPAFAERFTREGRALAKLNHPNIVSVFDFGKAGEFYWLMMEYVDGVNLRQAMQAGTMTPREALQVVPMICAALEYAHGQGVLHRDIKPENILIDTQGRVKIADFGVAKMRGDAGRHITLTLSGSALGTPAYMAPEQIERPQDVDHRADIYSLGVVFYEMLTGELPLGRFLAPSEKAGTDPRLDSVVFRTLEKERDRRYQTAGEMKTHVESYADAPRPQAPVREEKTSRKAVWGLILTLLGLLLGAGMFVTTAVKANNTSRAEIAFQSREPGHPPGDYGNTPQPGPIGQEVIAFTVLLGLIPLSMLLVGNALGASALKDIRAAEGKLGGKASAVFAAGTIPGILLVIVASMGFLFAGEQLMRGSGRRVGDIWPTLGAAGGIGLAFLVFRRLYLYAGGWKAPAAPVKRSVSCALAIGFTIAGAALALVTLVVTSKEPRSARFGEILAFLSLAVLLAGTISGVQARGEPAGRTSACLSGFLFVALVLLAFA